MTLSPASPPALSLSTIIWRYVRQFVRMDAREALQYVYCVCLSADQPGGVAREQVESAWELVRRIIVLANTGAAWEELVGGFRPDGTRFVCSRVPPSTHARLRTFPHRAERSSKAPRCSSWRACMSTTSISLFAPPSRLRRPTGYLRRSSFTTSRATIQPSSRCSPTR